MCGTTPHSQGAVVVRLGRWLRRDCSGRCATRVMRGYSQTRGEHSPHSPVGRDGIGCGPGPRRESAHRGRTRTLSDGSPADSHGGQVLWSLTARRAITCSCGSCAGRANSTLGRGNFMSSSTTMTSTPPSTWCSAHWPRSLPGGSSRSSNCHTRRSTTQRTTVASTTAVAPNHCALVSRSLHPVATFTVPSALGTHVPQPGESISKSRRGLMVHEESAKADAAGSRTSSALVYLCPHAPLVVGLEPLADIRQHPLTVHAPFPRGKILLTGTYAPARENHSYRCSDIPACASSTPYDQ